LVGLCSLCGRDRENKRWRLCELCRYNARAGYKDIPSISIKQHPPADEVIHGEPPGDLRGVRRRTETDSYGRTSIWWAANAIVGGVQRTRRWSVDKWGDIGAYNKAKAQREAWQSNKRKPI